jgi:hypothetical protein
VAVLTDVEGDGGGGAVRMNSKGMVPSSNTSNIGYRQWIMVKLRGQPNAYVNQSSVEGLLSRRSFDVFYIPWSCAQQSII